ncbi:MAG: RidA family protein [Patescibacteria group bacterium]|jgi:enamine deaminase RidA (YjgF/YER057c/UK114 family)
MEAPGQPYSTCVQVGNHFHFSGTIGIVENGRLKSNGNFQEQVVEVLQKMADQLIAVGLTPDDVHSATVMIVSDNYPRDYACLNDCWKVSFGVNTSVVRPRRKAFGVSWLPFDALVEIEFDAVKQSEG